jgi:hypothetical protein
MRPLFVLAAGAALAGACALFTPADRDSLISTSAQIAHCQEIGRACQADGGANCYGKYDDCMREAGMR